MMWHPLALAVSMLALGSAGLMALGHGVWRPLVAISVVVLAGLFTERLDAGVRAARQFRTATPLAFPWLHLARDAAWIAAIFVWVMRRVAQRPPQPAHSMDPRPDSTP
jgi:hypothetical protein